ncbi:MAG: hypothetical protein IKN38_07820 [Clostridia bacterium]|nr:hypothetical protein [Clostridia bacterium]
MKKLLKVIVVSALIFSLISLSLFIVFNSHHEHTDGYCKICVRIETAFGILKTILSLFFGAALLSYVFVRAKARCGASAADGVIRKTPPLIKVRYNN